MPTEGKAPPHKPGLPSRLSFLKRVHSPVGPVLKSAHEPGNHLSLGVSCWHHAQHDPHFPFKKGETTNRAGSVGVMRRGGGGGVPSLNTFWGLCISSWGPEHLLRMRCFPAAPRHGYSFASFPGSQVFPDSSRALPQFAGSPAEAKFRPGTQGVAPRVQTERRGGSALGSAPGGRGGRTGPEPRGKGAGWGRPEPRESYPRGDILPAAAAAPRNVRL